MIETVQISGTQQLQTARDRYSRDQIIQTIEGLGFSIKFGTADEKIELSGPNSVEEKIKQAQAFIYFGTPTIGEIFKAISGFVGAQTNDKNLMHKVDGREYLKPQIYYVPDFKAEQIEDDHNLDSITDPYVMYFRMLHDLHRAGTIKQDINSIITIATTPDELLSALIDEHKKPPVFSAHLQESGKKIEIDPRLLIPGTTLMNRYRPNKNRLAVCVYTSARGNQDPTSIYEAYSLGKNIAEMGAEEWTGLGAVGLMYDVFIGAIDNRGLASGSNCPHIMKIEGVPAGYAIAKSAKDIYVRIEDMTEPSDAFVVGGGGKGGGGTGQEYFAEMLLIKNKSPIIRPNPKFIPFTETAPIIVDNRLGMFASMMRLADMLGCKGLYRAVKGTEAVTNKLEDILRKGRSKEFSHERRAAESGKRARG